MPVKPFKEMTAADYQPATIEELADALDALVTALVKHRGTHRRKEPTIVNMAELFKVPGDVLHQRTIVDDPVEWALKHGITKIGRLMYDATKSTHRMSQIVDDVCERDPKRFGHRISPIDSCFHGIGSGNDVWVN